MEKIGRYTIDGELGRGACGVVYLAKDPRIQRQVALKTIHTRELTGSPEGRLLQERLAREAQSAGALNHNSIVTVYELDEEGDLTYIVMEYVDGPSLRELISGERLRWDRLLSILRETAAGLDFAHSKGIIHRDVKPANIMLNSSGQAKIADFGVAKMLESTSMTMTGMAVGTPSYMSPEQILTKPLDGRADQFSLAVIAYEMITGRKPFDADSLPGLIHQILSVEPPNAEQVNAEIGEPTSSVLRKALAKEASNRYPTCREFIQDLELSLAGIPGVPVPTLGLPAQTVVNTPVSPIPSGTSHVDPPARGAKPMVRAVLALALAVTLAAFYYSRKASGEPAAPVPQVTLSNSPSPERSATPNTPNEAAEKSAAVAPPVTPTNKKEKEAKKRESLAVNTEPARTAKTAPTEAPPSVPQAQDPGPDLPARSYMGAPEGRFSWSGELPAGDRLVIVRNRVRMGSIVGSGLPPGVAVQVDARPADIKVVQQPSSANGFRLIVSNQGAREINGFTIQWRELPH